MRKNRRIISLSVVALCLAVSTAAWAQFDVRKAGDSLVDAKALTIKGGFGQAINGKSFQQDAVITHAGFQYAGYYDADRLGMRRPPRTPGR